MEKKTNTKSLAISAILVALATALGYITLFRMPQGGSITPLSMLVIVLAGYFFGFRRGFIVGVAVGLLNLMFTPYIIHPIQVMLDYPLAFGALAIGSFMSGWGKYSIFPVYVMGVFGKFLCSVLSGVIFFSQFTPEGFNPWTWSIFYNGSFMGVEALITIAVLCIPYVRNTIEKLRQMAQRDF
ncbi:MAG: energy-coupled thiamine transporter ThiT [Eubacterium sp.]|nr:energy-coupled thiamine transporter ThiT [Eubacterium sp.]